MWANVQTCTYTQPFPCNFLVYQWGQLAILYYIFYSSDSLAIGYGDFGIGEGFIHLSNFICDGTEDSLFDCGASPVGQHFCNHGEDAGVICEGIRCSIYT